MLILLYRNYTTLTMVCYFYVLVEGSFKKNQWDQTSYNHLFVNLHLGFMFLGNQIQCKTENRMFLKHYILR